MCIRDRRNLASLLLAGAMTAALLTGPAQAAESPSPQEIAATRLQAEGLMNGDEHGDLHLDKEMCIRDRGNSLLMMVTSLVLPATTETVWTVSVSAIQPEMPASSRTRCV